MKRILILLAVLTACLVVFVACDSKKPPAETIDNSQTTNVQTPGKPNPAETDGSVEMNTNANTEADTATPAETDAETAPTETETTHTHAWGDWSTTKEATCTENGVSERACACGEREQQSINALGHTPGAEATCTTSQTCTVCGTELTAAKGHTEVVDAAVEPTCTAPGFTEGKYCSACNEVLVAQEVVPAAHKWTNEYEHDGESHWNLCTVCNAPCEKQEHTVGSDGYCSLCDRPIRATEGILYMLSADGIYAEVIGYVGDFTRIVIAEDYEGVPVTVIADEAFEGHNFTTIYIPDSVTSIGFEAFAYGSNLTFISLGNGVTSIGSCAFACCDSLTSIEIPDSVTSIGDGAFYYCNGLTSIYIPDSVTSIGDHSFADCGSLTSITLGNSVTSIGEDAFSGCYTNSIVIPDSVKSIESGAIGGCQSLTLPSIEDKKIGHFFAWGKVPDSLKTVVITGGSSIGKESFYKCTGLMSITIPASVTSIGSSAFHGCVSLTSITFEGTMEQWNAITFGKNWNTSLAATEVICSDGVVSLN